MGEKAFISVSNNTSALSLSPGSDVTFSTISQEEGIGEPAPGGSQITIKHHGKYLYTFKVDGVPTVPGAANLLGLTRNGTLIPATLTNNSGRGIVDLSHDDVVTLRLATNSPGGVLALTNFVGGANNAELTLVLIDS